MFLNDGTGNQTTMFINQNIKFHIGHLVTDGQANQRYSSTPSDPLMIGHLVALMEGSQRYSQPTCHHLSKKLGNYDELIDDYLVGEDLKMRVTSFLHSSINGTEYFSTFPQH